MNEAALGVHASGSRPALSGSEPAESSDDDAGSGGGGAPGGRITLRALLAVARLTPPQAAQLVADLLEQVELTATRRGRPVTLPPEAVTVSDGGRLTIDGVDSRIDVDDGLVDLIRGIAANCRGSGFGDLLRESVSGTVDPQESSHRIRRVIDPELDPDGEARRRRRIADLVEAATVRPSASSRAAAEPRDPSATRNGPAVATGSLVTGTGWYPPVRSPWHSRRRRPSRRQGLYAVLALVVLAGSAVAAPRAWDQLSRGWDALVHPVNASSAQNRIEPVSPPPPAPEDPAAAGGVAPAAVDTGAPAASGQITGVTASFADGSCSPGRPCAVRVDVRLDPSTVGAVTWKLNVYDRCTGEVREGSDVTIPAEPGRDGVYGLSRATLPDSPALAVAAITSVPAVAASEPLYVPAENAVCR